MKEEQVDVGEGAELAAPVPSERDHRALRELPLDRAVGPGRGLAAGPGHHQVHEVAPRRRDLGPAEAQGLAHAQALVLELQEAPEGLGRHGGHLFLVGRFPALRGPFGGPLRLR